MEGNGTKLWQRRYFKIAIVSLCMGILATAAVLADKLLTTQSEFETYKMEHTHWGDSVIHSMDINRANDLRTRDSLFQDLKYDIREVKQILNGGS